MQTTVWRMVSISPAQGALRKDLSGNTERSEFCFSNPSTQHSDAGHSGRVHSTSRQKTLPLSRFESRFLKNEYCVEHGKPEFYQGRQLVEEQPGGLSGANEKVKRECVLCMNKDNFARMRVGGRR